MRGAGVSREVGRETGNLRKAKRQQGHLLKMLESRGQQKTIVSFAKCLMAGDREMRFVKHSSERRGVFLSV